MGAALDTTRVADGAAAEAPRVISEAAALALGCAVQAHVQRGTVPEDRWRRALGLMCEEARRRDVRVERLIIALKEALASLPSVYRAPIEDRVALSSHLVALCIEEYYAQSCRDHAPARPLARRIACEHMGDRGAASAPRAQRREVDGHGGRGRSCWA